MTKTNERYGRGVETVAPMPSTKNTTPSGTPTLAESAGRCRLDSWKEIAVYLRREVRTVQRWEKNEGLPVHRHIHLMGGTVYALKEEINVWLKGRGETPRNSSPMQRCSGQAVNELNQPGRVTRQMLSAFRLWLTVIAKDSCLDGDDLAVPQRPQSKRKVRTRQLVTHRESRPLSLAYLRERVKIQTIVRELHRSGMGKTEPDF